MSRPLTARLTSRLGPVGAKLAGQPVVLTNVVGVVVGVATLATPLPAELKTGLVAAIVGVVTVFVPSQVVPVDKLVQGTVAQSAAGQPVTITPPVGPAQTIGEITP
jgi:xanthosine utilization system XapX-like protein